MSYKELLQAIRYAELHYEFLANEEEDRDLAHGYSVVSGDFREIGDKASSYFSDRYNGHQITRKEFVDFLDDFFGYPAMRNSVNVLLSELETL